MTEARRTLLFVCTGNTCRSPLAEVLARRVVVERGWEDRLDVLSAGSHAAAGYPASEGSLIVASNHGLDLSEHRSSLLTPELAAEADLILGLTPGHVVAARSVAPGARVELLGNFAAGVEEGGSAVPDPFGAPVEVYEATYAILEELVNQTMDRLAEEWGQG